MPYHARGSLAERLRREGPDRVAGGIADRCEVVRGTGNRASDRHFAPRYQARERARQRLRRTATERFRDRPYRRWIRNGDRVLHRHHRLHRARGAGRKSADGRVRRLLPWRHDLRADRRQCRARAQGRRGSGRALPADQFHAGAGHASQRESRPMCARRSRRRCRRIRRTAAVRGGVRSRVAVGAASQRVDSGFDGAQRARWRARTDGRHARAVPDPATDRAPSSGGVGPSASHSRPAVPHPGDELRGHLVGRASNLPGKPPDRPRPRAPPAGPPVTPRPGPPAAGPPWAATVRPPGARDAEEGPQADADRCRRRSGGRAVGGQRISSSRSRRRQGQWRSRRREPDRPPRRKPGWKPITNARVAREAVATTQADGTIWIFGGLGADGASADGTRATTPPSTAGRAATTYRFLCSMRCR